MNIALLLGCLRSKLLTFRASERGNIMITFALAAVPMIGMVGAAVDYSRGNSARVAIQSAIDATGLILSKEASTLTAEQLTQKANSIFLSQFNRPEVTNIVIVPTLTTPTPSSHKLTLNVTGKLPTEFTKFLGVQQMDLGVSTEIVWGVKKLELALALDVTGSMASNNKIDELKKAAKSLLTTLKKAAKSDGDVKIAIVPFNVNVNVNSSNSNAAWLDWSKWSGEPEVMANWIANNATTWSRTGPSSTCPFTNSIHGFRCSNGPAHRLNDSTISTIPSTGANAGLICPSRDNGDRSTAASGLLDNSYHNGCYTSVEKLPVDWYTVATGSSASCGSNPNCSCSGSGSSRVCRQRTYTHTWRPRPKTAWNGCVRDRNQIYDVQNVAPAFAWSNVQRTNTDGVLEGYVTANAPQTADAFQPFQHFSCPAASLPLTFDWTALNNKIDELAPLGATNVTIGLTWAFHALTASAPLNNAAAPNPGLDKVIILLTDGDNTQNRWSDTQSPIDARTEQVCANVKAANIKLYTIRVIDGNAALLRACATSPSMYYNVQNAADLNAVFTTIAQSLANLRVAK